MNAESAIRLMNMLVPILTPIVGAVVVGFREWRSRRSDIGRRKLALQDARAQVEFVNDWWNARRAVDESGGPGSPSSQEAERQARAWLDRASALVAGNELSLPSVEPAVTFRAMALLYDFRTTAGKVVRAGFWIFCGLTTLVVGNTITEWLGPSGFYTFGVVDSSRVRSYVIAGAVIIPLTIALRFLAVAVDNVAAQPNDPGRETYGFLREFLLLRRLLGRGAGAARVLFYVSAIWVVGYTTVVVWVGMQRPDLYWLLPLSVTAVAVYATAAFGLRAWAVHIDRAARRPSIPAQDKARDQVAERTFQP